MKPSDFEKRLAEITRIQKDSSREDLYKHLIRDLVSELNDATIPADKIAVLKQLKATDKHYFTLLGTPIEKEIVLTRHGHCSRAHKGYGLIPNTGVKESALEAMNNSAQYTEAMMNYADLQIVVSPMIRAMQTAGKLVSGKGNHIRIDPVLTENSKNPSGCDIRSAEQLNQMREKSTSLWMKFMFFLAKPSASFADKSKEELIQLQKDTWNPLKRLRLYFAINLYFSDEQLLKDRNNAINALKDKSEYITDEDKRLDSHRKVTLTKQDKIKGIAQLIKQSQTSCLWLIGHGNNFKTFVKAILGDGSVFDYTESRILYKIPTSDQQENRIVSPPYTLKFNQETGAVEGNYTGLVLLTQKSLEQVLLEQASPSEESEVLDGTPKRPSHVMMQDKGLRPSISGQESAHTVHQSAEIVDLKPASLSEGALEPTSALHPACPRYR